MNDTQNGHSKAQDLLERMLEGKPDAAKARVLNLVYRLRLDANDPLFLVMIAMNYLQVLIEDSPQEWENTFASFKEELDKWTELHLATLESLARRAESERTLADVSIRLGKLLENSMMSPTTSSIPSPMPTTGSRTSKEISQLQELWETSRSMDTRLEKHTGMLQQALHRLSRSLTAKVNLPNWLTVLLAMLALSSVYNFMTLETIKDRVLHPPAVSKSR